MPFITVCKSCSLSHRTTETDGKVEFFAENCFCGHPAQGNVKDFIGSHNEYRKDPKGTADRLHVQRRGVHFDNAGDQAKSAVQRVNSMQSVHSQRQPWPARRMNNQAPIPRHTQTIASGRPIACERVYSKPPVAVASTAWRNSTY